LSNFLKENKTSVIAIGRVMTCVLGLVVDREQEIRNFMPKKHYGITATFLSSVSNLLYKGKWVPQNKKDDKEADDEESTLAGRKRSRLLKGLKDTGKIKKVEVKTKKEQPPLLFNLAELQSEANKKFKLPVDKTLEIAQWLYEKKLITYPEPTAG